jgi:hypothetical protein
MQDKIENLFSGIELDKRRELVSLMSDWQKTVSVEENDCFGSDGFFPGYFETTPRLLFIAREPRYSDDLISLTIEHFQNEDVNDNDPFWRRILCMCHIIRNNGIIDGNITAGDIAKSMVQKNNFGFAYMNLSKYRHDSGQHDPVLMNKFLKDSKLDKRNFLKEELEFLNPDIIITAYLWNGAIHQEEMDAYFGEIDFLKVRYLRQSRRLEL